MDSKSITAGVTDHGALTGLADDDHPQYETSAEAAAKVTTHEAAADPHTGYRLESADHSHASTGLQGGQISHDTALTGVSADDHHTEVHAIDGAAHTGDIETAQIAADAVTFAKVQNIATDRVLGRDTAGSGDIEELTLGTNLTISGGALNASGGGTTHALARKTADESVTSSTTLQDDDHLTFAIAANEEWAVQGFLVVGAAQAGDFKWAWSAPVGATGASGGIGMQAAQTNESAVTSLVMEANNTVTFAHSNYGSAGQTTEAVVPVWGYVVNGANAGSVTLKWAQGDSSGTATIVRAGSYLVAHKVV